MPTVLFVCEGNRFRSQIAEALFNAWAPPGWHGISAGTNPKPNIAQAAIDLVDEWGIDISHQKPKPIDLAEAEKAWRVIAMCSVDSCPIEVRDKTEHWGVPDPADVPADRLHEIRDAIAERMKALIREIGHGQKR